MRNLLWKLFGISKNNVLKRIINLNTAHNIACSASYLPLVSRSPAEIEDAYTTYYSLINDLTQINQDTHKKNDITIKLYQFWQYLLSKNELYTQFSKFCSYAKAHNIFVRIDTSDRTYHSVKSTSATWNTHTRHIIQETVQLYKELLENGFSSQQIGLCISANITSYQELLQPLFETQIPSLRLVKGFYNNYDLTSRSQVSQNYLDVAQWIRWQNTQKIAFATHDHLIIQKLIETYSKLPKRSQVELQSFVDVHNAYIYKLAETYTVRVYIPFGKTRTFLTRWRPWFDKIRARERILWVRTYDPKKLTPTIT